ncbi:MAG: hypothetical protein K2W94_01455 [Alphaproteobacteria bacterium]|nr:hypothetical protein [Alphaproteobacteria bacterium]
MKQGSKNILAALVLAILANASMASVGDLSDLPKDIKRKAAANALGLIDNDTGTAKILNFNSNLVPSFVRINPDDFTSLPTKELFYGVKGLFSFLIEAYAENNLDLFISGISGLPGGMLHFDDFMFDTKQGFLGLSASEIDKVGREIAAKTRARIPGGGLDFIEEMREVSRQQTAARLEESGIIGTVGVTVSLPYAGSYLGGSSRSASSRADDLARLGITEDQLDAFKAETGATDSQINLNTGTVDFGGGLLPLSQFTYFFGTKK